MLEMLKAGEYEAVLFQPEIENGAMKVKALIRNGTHGSVIACFPVRPDYHRRVFDACERFEIARIAVSDLLRDENLPPGWLIGRLVYVYSASVSESVTIAKLST